MDVSAAMQSQLRNIEARYGKPIDDWLRIVRSSELTKHTDVVAFLKTKYGMSHGDAHRIGLVARNTSTSHDNLYDGKRAALLPIHERLLAAIHKLGKDITLAPKKGYISIRRGKQFAMIRPAAAHIDVGLLLRGVSVTQRLESAATFNALFTHRVRVKSVKDVDKELIGWLRRAYQGAA